MKTQIIKKRRFKWELVVGMVLFAWIIYSLIGITFGPEKTKENGNVCKGYDYGFKVCRGDINKD